MSGAVIAAALSTHVQARASGNAIASGNDALTTNSVTVTAWGGAAPYTYAWTWQSGGTGITITSASASSTTFSGNPPDENDFTGVALCTVTDAGGRTATATCGVSLMDPPGF